MTTYHGPPSSNVAPPALPRRQRHATLRRSARQFGNIAVVVTGLIVVAIAPQCYFGSLSTSVASAFLCRGTAGPAGGLAPRRLSRRHAKSDEGAFELNSEVSSSSLSRSDEALASGPITDIQSLVEKYGGKDEVMALFKQAGDLVHMSEGELWLTEADSDCTPSKRIFEHAGGGRLALLGTSHRSRRCMKLAAKLVRVERPTALVLEMRMGDDGLRRLSTPDIRYQELLKPSPGPSVLYPTDSPSVRLSKLAGDLSWLTYEEGVNGLGTAYLGLEWSAAFEEFAKLHDSKDAPKTGARGAILCLGDVDLRLLTPRSKKEEMEGVYAADLGWDPLMGFRDLYTAEALLALLRGKERVVGVVGSFHLDGITKLLLQDPNIAMKEVSGSKVEDPFWWGQVASGAPDWVKDVSGPSSALRQFLEEVDKAPMGTFLSGEAVKDLLEYRQKGAAKLEERKSLRDLKNSRIPLLQSSEIAETFEAKGTLVTPRDEDELKRWLDGQDIPSREIGEFILQSP